MEIVIRNRSWSDIMSFNEAMDLWYITYIARLSFYDLWLASASKAVWLDGYEYYLLPFCRFLPDRAASLAFAVLDELVKVSFLAIYTCTRFRKLNDEVSLISILVFLMPIYCWWHKMWMVHIWFNEKILPVIVINVGYIRLICVLM